MNWFSMRFLLVPVVLFSPIFLGGWQALGDDSAQECKRLQIPPSAEQDAMPASALMIEIANPSYPAVHLLVEVATTETEQQRGLMHRPYLAENAGMLFDFKTPRPIQMWMKNTAIPLDMLFINGAGRISHIAPMTTPFALDLISSNGPARAVLEINGGLAEKLGIQVGDHVRHPIFNSR